MDIKTSIESRKSAFYSAYDINDNNIKTEIDNLFKRIEEFGKSCKDGMDFESKFATSPLNTEYINMFTKVATTCKCKMQPVQDDPNVETDEEFFAREAKEDLEYAIDSATQPLRHEAYEQGKAALRSTKLGNALFNANNQLENANHLRKLFSKKKDNE